MKTKINKFGNKKSNNNDKTDNTFPIKHFNDKVV